MLASGLPEGCPVFGGCLAGLVATDFCLLARWGSGVSVGGGRLGVVSSGGGMAAEGAAAGAFRGFFSGGVAPPNKSICLNFIRPILSKSKTPLRASCAHVRPHRLTSQTTGCWSWPASGFAGIDPVRGRCRRNRWGLPGGRICELHSADAGRWTYPNCPPIR